MPTGKKGAPLRAVGRGQERVGGNPYEERRNTRKRVEGVTIMQREMRKLPQYARLPMSDLSLIRAARDEWSRLSPQQREHYEILAKQENAKNLEQNGITWQRDTYGRSLLSEKEKNQQRQIWIKKSDNHIQKMLSGTLDEIIRKEFHIITVNTFLNTGSFKRPEDVHVILAEITLLRFSIKDGKTGEINIFPDRGEVPSGHMADIVDSTETHGITLDSQGQFKISSASEVTKELRQFIVGLDEGPVPIFTREHDIDKVRLGLVHIYNQIDSQCPWNDSEGLGFIYPLEKLAAFMMNRGIDINRGNPHEKMNPIHATQYWTDQPTLLVGKQCCMFHSFIDKTLECSKSQAFACLWWLLSFCVGRYDVKVSESHFPREIQEKQRRLAMNNLTPSEAGDGFYQEPAASSATAARGFGRGVTLEEPPIQRLGRGRGRSLRGRLPKHLD